MELWNRIFACLSVVPTALVSVFLFLRVKGNRNTDWKIATCLCAMATVTSLIILLAAEKVSFLRYGDVALEVNQKADEVRRLTEQNKRIAKLAASAIVISGKHVLADESYQAADTTKAIEDLLTAAGANSKEIDEVLERTNSPAKSR